MSRFAILILVPWVLLGNSCAGTSEADRALNHQSKEAGKFIKTNPDAPPVVQQAGADVEANSAALEKNLLGSPKDPTPYSPDESKRQREQSDTDHTTPWWKLILGGLGTAAITWFSRGGLLRLLPGFAGGPVGIGLNLLVEGISRVREKAAASGGNVPVADLLATLKETTEANPAAHALIRDLAHKAEAKLAARL